MPLLLLKTQSDGASDSSGALFALNWMMALGLAYLIGLLWHLTGLTRQLMRLYLVMRSSKRRLEMRVSSISLPINCLPFNLFPLFVLQDGTSLFPEVEAHERVHIRQFHTIDLLAALLFRSVFGFILWQAACNIISENSTNTSAMKPSSGSMV